MSDTADFLKAVQHAMRLEGIPEESVEHVINRLMYGDPHPPKARQPVTQVIVNMSNAPAPEQIQRLGARIQAMRDAVLRGQLG